MGVEGIDGGEIHHRAEEVFADFRALAGVQDVLPDLAAFPLGPGETALVDRDAELGRLPDEVEEEGFRGSHGVLRVGDGARSGPSPGRWTAPAEGTARLLVMCGRYAGGLALRGEAALRMLGHSPEDDLVLRPCQ